MSRAQYAWQPDRRPISVPDPRLNKLLVREPYRFATISEYASATGMTVETVVSQLRPFLDGVTLGLETVGGEIFLMTAPAGRPISAQGADVAPNLWEILRANLQLDEANATWMCCRALERAGWRVETSPERVRWGLGHVSHAPNLALALGETAVPVLLHPVARHLGDMTGPLSEYERAGAPAVAVVCRGGELDPVTTEVRRWILSHRGQPSQVTVLVLEEPRLAPVLLSARDAAVTPRTVDRTTLDTLTWSDPRR
jgi:hypothetical protein